MNKEFTSNDLVRFIYKETSAAETLAIAEAITDDARLNEEYQDLRSGYLGLFKASFSPSKNVIKNILGYSEQTALEAQF